MRMLLFRGKDIKTGKWIYGSALPHDGDRCTIAYQSSTDGSLESYEIEPETVGQYTGSRDKNGWMIFEGDIVSGHIANYEKITGAIVYNSAAEFIIDRKGLCGIGLNCVGDWGEVVGNIHDNPELLEESTR